jgi:hypothetical protein
MRYSGKRRAECASSAAKGACVRSLWCGGGGKIRVTSRLPQSCEHESSNGGKSLATHAKAQESAGVNWATRAKERQQKKQPAPFWAMLLD